MFLGGKHFPTSKNVTDDCGLSVVRPCPGHVASFTLDVSEDKYRFGSWFTGGRRKFIAVSANVKQLQSVQ